MKKIAFLFLVFYSFTLFSNDVDYKSHFKTKIIYQGEKGLIDFEIIDFNNDQINDIVICNYFLHSIDWLEGTAQGTYIKHSITTLFQAPSKFLVEDFTHDGKKDVVVSGSNGLYLFVQEDLNSFKRKKISEFTIDCWGLKAIDVDKDNRLDIVSISQKNSTLMWHQNTGVDFQNILISDTLNQVYSLDVVDINHDTNIDIIVSSKKMNKVHIYLNNQDSFTPYTLCSNTFSAKTKGIDVNQDEYIDIVCTPTNQSNFHIHYNHGNMIFITDTILIKKNQLVIDINEIDHDENGLTDLCFNDYISNRTALFSQNEPMNFSYDTLYDYQNSHVTSMEVVDFDADSDVDILLCNVFDGTITQLDNQKYNPINYVKLGHKIYVRINNNELLILILFFIIICYLFYKNKKSSNFSIDNKSHIEVLQQKISHQELINFRQNKAIQEVKDKNTPNFLSTGLDKYLNELKELNPKINDTAIEYKLSQTEYRLLVFIKAGLNNHDISEMLSVSTSTIYVQRQRLKTKLKLTTTKALHEFINSI